MFFCSVSWANNNKNPEKNFIPNNIKCENDCEKKYDNSKSKNSTSQKESCENEQTNFNIKEIEDDEYFSYNLCFFDKQYRNMKRSLCLTRRQEECIDELYRNFKFDMENLHFKYQNEKDCLLKAIECNCRCNKNNISNLKEIKKEAKEKTKDFKNDIEEHLCKNQKRDFKKFQKHEKRKLKKIAKYSKVYKFPCMNCHSK